MRIKNEAQAPPKPARERQPAPPVEAKAKAVKAPEKAPEPPKPEGKVGKNIDTHA